MHYFVENLLTAEVRYKLHCFFTYTDILVVVLSCLTMCKQGSNYPTIACK